MPDEPLLLPLVALALGIAISRWVRFEPQELWLAGPLLFGLTLAAYRYGRRAAYPACLVTLCCLGIWVDVAHRPAGSPSIDAGSQETVTLSGCVVDPPIFYQDRDQFTVELAPKVSARASLTLREGEAPPDLAYGQRVEFEAKVRPIRNFRNPGSFDFAGYSARRQIYWNASVSTGSQVRVLPGRCGSRFFAAIFALRTMALRRLEALYPDDPYATGMMQAILLGETTKMEKIWTDHFRRTGTFHALVISGMHISVLAGTLLFLMRLCFVPEIPALAVTAVAAWVYALVSGWSAPAVRAAGAFTLYLIGRYFYRRRGLVNLLAAVGLGYLLYDPGQMFESSFQLSFLSVLAIAVLAVPLLDATSMPFNRGLAGIEERTRDPKVEPRAGQLRLELRLLAETLFYSLGVPEKWGQRILAWCARLVLYIYEMVAISTVVQVGLALPMAIYFHRISFSGLSANVIIVPLLSVVIPIGFVSIATGWHWVAGLARVFLVWSEWVANWHMQWEPDRRIPDPPLWLSVAFVAALLVLAWTVRRGWRCWVPSVGVLALFTLLVAHPFREKTNPNSLEMTAIDVGQGDGLLVAFPDGKLLLVDGGGFPNYGRRKNKPKLDIGEDVISPYLWSRSINKINAIICTHAHEDHAGGLAALIDNFHPDELWTGANGESAVWQAIREKARARHVQIKPMRCCIKFKYGGTEVEALSPAADYEPSEKANNNDSLAVQIRFGKHTFLLTGDMEAPSEAQLFADGRLGHVDVLKVGHHGSKTSSTEPFLAAIQPAFAVISDGFENSFHHPHPSVLARLAEHHTSVLRTDQMGLITIRSDGRRLSMETVIAQPRGPNLSY